MSDDYIEAANQNPSFKQIMRDPDRNLIESALDVNVYLLERAGVPQHKIADHLFEHLLHQLSARGKTDSQTAVTLYFQIEKFHAKLTELRDALRGPDGAPDGDQNGHIDHPQ